MSEENIEVNQNTYDEVTICTKCKTALFGSGEMLCGSCENEGNSEVFEGVVKLVYVDVFDFGDILSDDGEEFSQTLIKHEGKRVKVTIEFLT